MHTKEESWYGSDVLIHAPLLGSENMDSPSSATAKHRRGAALVGFEFSVITEDRRQGHTCCSS